MSLRPALLLTVLLAGCAGPSTPEGGGAGPAPAGEAPAAFTSLDKTLWSLHVEPMDGGGKPYDDDLLFSDRHAAFKEWEGRGFAATGFSTAPHEKDGTLGFEFETRSPQGDALAVSGCANADAVWGTLIWRRADWTMASYRFRGTRRK